MKKTFFKIFKYGMILLVLLCVGIFVYIKTSPKPEIYSANNITLYDSTDTVFFQGNESKAWVSLDEISDNVIKSTIYTEDKNFYKHFGFDILRILKASYINITSGKTMQGASTITQQYAKNLFLDFDKTWKRKWDEMWYTMKIEANYSKDEILEGYLNTIDFNNYLLPEFERIAEDVRKINNFEGESEIILLVYETPDNPCSERGSLMEYFKAHGIIIEEYKKR